MFGSLAGHQHRARDICGEHSFEIFPIEIHEALEHANPRIVYKNVEIAELLQDFAIRPLHVGLYRDVRANRMRSQLARRLGEAALVAPSDRNARSARDEGLRYRAPDPAAPTRDQRHSIFQVHLSSAVLRALRYCHSQADTVMSRSALPKPGSSNTDSLLRKAKCGVSAPVHDILRATRQGI